MACGRWISAFILSVACVPATLQATIFRSIALDEKVEHAAAIVVGVCIGNTSRFDAGGDRILTYSTIRVEKTLKGFPSPQLTVVLPGGTVGNITQVFVDVPVPEPGKTYVLFVRNTAAGPTVLYFRQGMYTVTTDGTGQRHVQPFDPGAMVIGTQRGTTLAPEPARPLRDFERAVREIMIRREKQRMEVLERQRRRVGVGEILLRNWPLVAVIAGFAGYGVWRFFRR